MAVLALGITTTMPACLEAEFSDLDTSNGGLLGAVLALASSSALSGQTTTFYTFTDSLNYFTSTGNGEWTANTASGATSQLLEVKHGGGQTLWALDGKANDNIVRSDNLGATWSSVPVSADLFLTLDVCGDTIFATYTAGPSWRAVYSNDGGSVWNDSQIAAATVTVEDATCADSVQLVAVKNTSAPISSSINGGAGWGGGGAVATGSPHRVALQAATNTMLYIYADGGGPAARTTTDFGANFGPPDTSTFALHTWSGASYATGDGFYLAMNLSGSCDIFFSATGAPASYTQQSASCSAGTTLTHLTQANTTALYGGTDGGGGPLVYRLDQSTNQTFQETLPVSAASQVNSLLSITN